MPAPMTLARGNQLVDTGIALVMTPPASIVTTAVTYGTYTVIGLQPLDIISLNVQASPTNWSVTNAWVSAINTLSVGFSSESGSTVSGAAAVNVLLEVIRLENANLGFSNLPTQLV